MFEEKKYLQRLTNIAKYIVNEINKNPKIAQSDTLASNIVEGPNYMYDVIPADGSLLLYVDGLPDSFFTPFGRFTFANSYSCEGVADRDFMSKLIAKLNLVKVGPSVYALTHDLDGKPFTIPEYTIPKYGKFVPNFKPMSLKEWSKIRPDLELAKAAAAVAEPVCAKYDEAPDFSCIKQFMIGCNVAYETEWVEKGKERFYNDHYDPTLELVSTRSALQELGKKFEENDERPLSVPTQKYLAEFARTFRLGFFSEEKTNEPLSKEEQSLMSSTL